MALYPRVKATVFMYVGRALRDPWSSSSQWLCCLIHSAPAWRPLCLCIESSLPYFPGSPSHLTQYVTQTLSFLKACSDFAVLNCDYSLSACPTPPSLLGFSSLHSSSETLHILLICLLTNLHQKARPLRAGDFIFFSVWNSTWRIVGIW